jgi:four helix bundle protein
MRYKEWSAEIPKEITNDALWKMNVYRYALFLADVVWDDVNKLSKNQLLISSCDQLYRSAGSVSANISEGYSRRSNLDQARFYEYALGSARECRGWFFKIRHGLDDKVLNSRLKLLTEIIRMLLYIVPTQRGGKINEPKINYLDDNNSKSDLIENIELNLTD